MIRRLRAKRRLIRMARKVKGPKHGGKRSGPTMEIAIRKCSLTPESIMSLSDAPWGTEQRDSDVLLFHKRSERSVSDWIRISRCIVS
jgi:hypothetical protein